MLSLSRYVMDVADILRKKRNPAWIYRFKGLMNEIAPLIIWVHSIPPRNLKGDLQCCPIPPLIMILPLNNL